MPERRPRVLVLARTYPNNVLPTLGLWTRRLVRASLPVAEPVVIAPVPYAPPGIPQERYARYRRVPRFQDDEGVPVHHPRVPAGPGNLLLSFDADLAYPVVRRLARRLHAEQSFDLIHAHFIYPDGVVASRLGKRLGIPVLSTEQSIWGPALARFPRMRKQVVRALDGIRLITTVSEAARESLLLGVGRAAPVEILPNVVDEEAFPAPRAGDEKDPDQVLFVGLIRRVKGLDILVRAMPQLLLRRPSARLKVVGGTFYSGQEGDWREVQQLVKDLRLESHIDFAGEASPAEVAAAMRRSAVLVLPSRREAFPAVILEALASGTPVVATRCGGPEELVTSELGRLVPPEDPESLAVAIAEVLDKREQFDPARLREYVLTRFGAPVIGARIGEIYRKILRQRPQD